MRYGRRLMLVPHCDAQPSLHYKRDGKWNIYTWSQYYDYVMKIARALIANGFQERRGICILGFNRPGKLSFSSFLLFQVSWVCDSALSGAIYLLTSAEWHCCNMAGIFANGISTGLYSTNNPVTNIHMINTSGAQFVFVDTKDNAKRILAIKDKCPCVDKIIQWDPKVRNSYISLSIFILADSARPD